MRWRGGEGMLRRMPDVLPAESLVLVLDTCGERASVALFRGDEVLGEEELAERSASAALLGGLRGLLAEADVRLGELAGIGVVNGPGSFTGVRVGLAVAKGLCEASGVKLAAVSRLSVLGDAAGLRDGFAVLSAGRDQVYVRELGGDAAGREWMTSFAALQEVAARRDLAVTNAEVGSRLTGAARVHVVELFARHALGRVRACLEQGGSDPATTDANYVRNEEAIYGRKHGSQSVGS